MELRGKIQPCIFILSLVLFLCGTISCEVLSAAAATLLETQSNLNVPSEANWSGATRNEAFDGTKVQFEVPRDVRTLSLAVNGPVDIFMVKMNVGSTVIPAASTRYVVSAATGSAQAALSAQPNRSVEQENSLLAMEGLEMSGISASGIIRRDYAPARDFVPPVPSGAGGASRLAEDSVGGPVKSVAPGNFTVGSTKWLWVDLPKAGIGTSGYESKFVGMATYTKRPATLRAVGEKCCVWVLDENFATTASGSKISSAQAEALAAKFDGMYQLIRNVFGAESDKMVGKAGLLDINSASDTGSRVNIVVYDIEGDYTATQTGGTMGYFWAKDYYTAEYAGGSDATSLTNGGKYFYVDSHFLNVAPQMMYSTLAHEFQHMIDFGQKTIPSIGSSAKMVSSSTWFNEMMSMVCEDMIQEYLGLSDQDSPVARLPVFCLYYYLSGLTDWLDGSSVQASYAGAYAFGAYLARNYGGTALINKIATNGAVDQAAITQALSGTGETFDSVFRKYAQALVLDNAPVSANVPTFNKSVAGISGNMKAIDIFNVQYQDEYGRMQALFPARLKADANSRKDLRPNGFTLHNIGYTESAGTVNLTFSSPTNDNEKVYVLVQPHG